jgi:GNAT superfamily N-acetyltransferase
MVKTTRLDIARFLPGHFTLTHGTIRDYDALAPFHYLAPRPATIADIRVVRYRDGPRSQPRPVAVGVLSYPVPSSFGRQKFLHRQRFTRSENLVFANRHIRTISRVIVHPQFRSLGLSTLLVRCLCRHCKTRYVEAHAAMGRIHPLFERAGMKRVHLKGKNRPVYFILDRKEKQS